MKNVLPAVVLLAVFASGCPRPEAAFRGETYEEYSRNYRRETLLEVRDISCFELRHACRFAIANNPDYRAAFHAVESARYRYYQALGAYLPRIDGSFALNSGRIGNFDRLNPPSPDDYPYQTPFGTASTLGASYLVFDGLARTFRTLIARRAFDREAALDRNARRLLLRAVAYAYYDVLLADEMNRIAQSDLVFQKSSLEQAQSRLKFGLAPLGDVLNFRIQANRSRSLIAAAAARCEITRYALSTLIGIPATMLPGRLVFARLEPDGMPAEVGSVETYFDQAVANRPDLKAFRFALAEAYLERLTVISSCFPVVTAFFDLNFSTWQARYTGYAYDRGHYNQAGYTYGLEARMNFFEGFRTWNRYREARERERIAAWRLDSAFLSALDEVASAHANYRNAVIQTELYRETLAWVFQQRQLVYTEYLGGRETITRVNGAQSALVGAESEWVIALANRGKAYAQLMAAVNADELYPVQPEEHASPVSTPVEGILDALEKRFPGTGAPVVSPRGRVRPAGAAR